GARLGPLVALAPRAGVEDVAHAARVGGDLVGLVEAGDRAGEEPSEIGRGDEGGLRPRAARVLEVVVGALVAQHECDYLVHEFVFAYKLAIVDVLLLIHKLGRWPYDGLLSLLVLGN